MTKIAFLDTLSLTFAPNAKSFSLAFSPVKVGNEPVKTKL